MSAENTPVSCGASCRSTSRSRPRRRSQTSRRAPHRARGSQGPRRGEHARRRRNGRRHRERRDGDAQAVGPRRARPRHRRITRSRRTCESFEAGRWGRFWRASQSGAARAISRRSRRVIAFTRRAHMPSSQQNEADKQLALQRGQQQLARGHPRGPRRRLRRHQNGRR